MDNELQYILNSVLESPGNICIFSVDRNLCYTAFNTNYEQYVLVMYKLELKIGNSHSEIFKSFIDKKNEISYLKNALNGEEFTQIGTYSAGSKIIHYKDLYRPVYDSNKNIIGVTVFYEDITERKRAEKTWSVLLNISEKINISANLDEFIGDIRAELSKIIDTKNFYVALFDKDKGVYRFPFFVDEFDEIDKLTDVALERTVTDYIRRAGEPLFLDRPTQYQFRNEGKFDLYGTPAQSWIGVPLKIEEEVIGVMVVQSYDQTVLYSKRDVDLMSFVSEHIAKAIERKKISQELVKTHQRLKYAQQVAKLGHLEYNLRTEYIRMSEEAYKIFGFTNNEKIKYADLLSCIHPEDKQRVTEVFRKLGSEISFYDEIFRVVNNGSGKIIYVHSKADIDVSLNKIKAVLQDVTEQQISRLELKKAKERAEESDVLKSVFLANMSHEIRTPMNAILGFSNLMLERNISNEMQKKYAEYIFSSANNLLGLINDILDVAKIEAGQFSIIESSISINELLNDIFRVFEEQKKTQNKANVELRLQKPKLSDDILIVTDPLRLRQVLINLVGNALKFTFEGYVEFGYTIADSNNLHFYVKDTGIGIPEDKKELVFSRFGQIIDNKIKHPGGTGLGLSISKHLVEALGGEIGFNSKNEGGTIFHFTIPFIYQIRQRIDSEKQIEQEILITNNLKILVIEDVAINRILFLDSLNFDKDQANIDFAFNGEEAIEKFAANEYDIVFMDIMMTGIDGYEATSLIRKTEKGRKIPIIGLSAHAMKEASEKGIECGMNDFITKPFVPADIRKVISKYVFEKKITENVSLQSKHSKVDLKYYKYINLQSLVEIYGTQEDKLRKIVGLYTDNIDKQLSILSESIQNSDNKNARITAHTLKSGFRYLGVEELGEIAREIEEQIGVTPLDKILVKLEKMSKIWDEAGIEAKRIANGQ